MTPKEQASKINYDSLRDLNLELLSISNDFLMQGERKKAKTIHIAVELFDKILKNKAPKEAVDSILGQQTLFDAKDYTKPKRPYGL